MTATRSDARPRLYALLSSPLRCLPDFMIIGAQKSGTTSLNDYLTRHPALWTPPCKECNFFTKRAGPAWRYRAFFLLERRRRTLEREVGRPILVGEATPYYLFHPDVPGRVVRMLPETRLVVLLRDPVERAWSHYRHGRRLGFETLSFEDALDAEPERIARGGDELRHFSYVARGRYAEQLRRWYEHFDRAQVHVAAAETLFERPEETTAAIEAFLGLPPAPGRRLEVLNRNELQEPMRDETRARLRTTFAEPTAELEELLGVRMPWPRD